jgi:hypothetical protein
MPAGVGGASVTPGAGITDAACAQPLSSTAAASTAGSFFAQALTGALCSSHKRFITGTH